MSKAKSIIEKMENGGFRPGELASLFIQKLGGKEAFVQDMANEWEHAPRGSAIRKSVLDIIKQDMAKAHEGAMTLEDLDDEALEEIADNAERKVAEARIADGAGDDAKRQATQSSQLQGQSVGLPARGQQASGLPLHDVDVEVTHDPSTRPRAPLTQGGSGQETAEGGDVAGLAALAAEPQAAAGSADAVAGADPGDQRSAEPGGDHAGGARAGDAGPLDPEKTAA